ncbi:hypothetical protein CDD80_1725 [Ophiocordyceps camponoti-rufipedis]|uniref:Structural maintenance of chromosomes protein 5 n=1 Tax=Ophiocordyceps camponoti-rufipedis TaxID=2004952 RepID=A0A2C5Z924_9HYPO|nr:hypothetical protein CDD80_1725 [Ophiocordyceps camponoti-rufipedis]
MAHSSSRRRRREGSDEGDPFDSDQHDADPPKRRRLDLGSNGTDLSSQDPGIADDFHPGAIIRVKVINFVTYESAEFFPGPNLNMVIGPNGTGKSSLVCAICLGLGYSPKLLGRAGSVKEFVKHGKDTATIEIELQKRPSDRTNFVVSNQIRREQNSQKWWLNGKETTHKTVLSLMKSLKIQVDNLCQFLPQDRVVEFAACTPVDLLRETLRAAAPEEMLLWQSELRELHGKKKDMGKAVLDDVEDLKNLESRQQGLQADVDRIREREEIQARVTHLQSALVLAQYQEVRAKYQEARERKKDAEAALRWLQQECEPSLQAVNRKMEYTSQIEAAVSGIDEDLKQAGKEAINMLRDANQAAETINEMKNQLDAERKGFDTKRKELAASKSKITAYQADLKNQPPEFNAADWNQKIRAQEHIMRELDTEQEQVMADLDSVKTKGSAVVQRIKNLEHELRDLDTQQGQQMILLKKYFPEAYDVLKWLNEHQHEFEKEVFGPPMISCSIKDERFSNLVQTFMQRDDFVCFTPQTKNDHKKLSHSVFSLLSTVATIRTVEQPLESFKRPLSPEQAASYGFDGFVLDYIDGPAPVLAMLCSNKGFHQTALSLRAHNDSDYERIARSGVVTQWAAGEESFQIRGCRDYGSDVKLTTARAVTPGMFWTSQPVDSQEKTELSRLLREKNGEKDLLRNELNQLKEKKSSFDERRDETYKKMESLRKEKSSLQKDYQKWRSLPEKIESEERNKTAKETALRDTRKSMADLGYEWDEATTKRARLVIQHNQLLDKMRSAHHASLESQIRLIEARSDVKGLKLANASLMERLDAEKDKVATAAAEVAVKRQEGHVLQEKVRDVMDQDEATRELLTQLAEGKTPQELEMDMSAEEAKLEVMHAANPNIMREFERRAKEIDRLKAKMDEANQALSGLDGQLEGLMAKWEPKLDELVSSINDAFAYNFEQISCAGEVHVHKDDDFDKWALNIKVRFRPNETLQQLTAHRQSGGERAVSTIFFLMALQSMAQSPFRVVDEINQGMDPRNERMVHERMVEIACREHTSQYFLITPKLLTGLRYDAKMRVLCIASGEHMPSDGLKLDFGRCLARQRALMGVS